MMPRCGLLLLLCLQTCFAKYLFTVPQNWAPEFSSQVCLTVLDSLTPEDSVKFTLFGTDSKNDDFKSSFYQDKDEGKSLQKEKLLEKNLQFDMSKLSSCVAINVPKTTRRFGVVKLSGTLQGSTLNQFQYISFVNDGHQIFIQTDKYLYKADQKVQFRLLSVGGPFLKVSTAPYAEIYIKSPSSSRIAQWLNVTNPSGLLHKEFQLIKEPEEGTYIIFVKKNHGDIATQVKFKVEDYVLPRFEVTIIEPKYVLSIDDTFSFRVCANYTFGQPLRGKLSGTVNNEGRIDFNVKILVSEDIFGCKDLKFNTSTFQVTKAGYYANRLSLSVTVEEEGTGAKVEERSVTEVKKTPFNLINKNVVKYQKPEIPYIALLEATFHDGTPVVDEPFSVCSSEICRNVTSDVKGFIYAGLPPHLSSLKVKSLNHPEKSYNDGVYNRVYMRTPELSIHPPLYFSPSNSSLQIAYQSSTKVECNADGNVTLTLPVIYATPDMKEAQLNIQIISRGQIQHSSVTPISFVATEMPSDFNLISPMQEPFNKNTVRGKTDITVSIAPTMSPQVKVLIWYTRPDGEVVPDTRNIELAKCLPHRVSLSWPEKRVEQGTTLPLTLKAQPNSICSLGIVDKSVELLAEENESQNIFEKIFDSIDWFQQSHKEFAQTDDEKHCKGNVPYPKPYEEDGSGNGTFDPPRLYLGTWIYSTNHIDAVFMFENAGLFIISDLEYETRPCNEPVLQPDIVYYDSPFAIAGGGHPASDNQAARTYFPETWLWQLVNTPSDGVYIKELKLPDTITEWVGKAVCVHPDEGVGLSGSTSITTFTPFFVDITMLPNIKKGEIMPIIISVFNYLQTDLPVKVTITPSPEFEILVPESTSPAEDQAAAGTFTLCVPQGDKNTASLRLRPLAVGDVDMIISATIDNSITSCNFSEPLPTKTDTIIKPLTVELEGFPKEKTWTKYICSEDINENQDYAAKWRLEAPIDIVPDSGRSWVTVVGDLMGPTLENLGGLIRMPYGCGEQNMLNFAPNIYVLQYLEASNQINNPTRVKLNSYMTNGYLREMKYKHRDGSYSAFGSSDSSGSTWLTAFVVKSYAQARRYIDIDSAEIEFSSKWIKELQMPDGCFRSVGLVLHKGMKGGLSDAKPKLLSAYVLIALLEAGEDPQSAIIRNAILCFEGSSPQPVVPDAYELSIIAYASSLTKDPSAENLIQSLLEIAMNTSTSMHWEIKKSGTEQYTPNSALEVETAAYVLLAILEADADKYMNVAHQIVKWISEHRNSQGGFISTQDTVVALQAMALYESYKNSEPLNMYVNFTGTDHDTAFKVIESNRLLNQREDIAILPNNVFINTNGTGCALAQAVVRYNVKDAEASDAFALNVSLSNEPYCKYMNIKVCTSYLLKDGKSNMAVVEVSLVSGYVPDKNDLKEIVKGSAGHIKRYEVDGRKVLFYIEEFSPTELCLELKVSEEVKVTDPKPGTVKVYDYYEPEFEVTEKYDFKLPCVKIVPIFG